MPNELSPRPSGPGWRTLALVGAAVLSAVIAGPTPSFAAETNQAAAHDAVFPPWQHGRNNDATQRGLDFTIPEVDVLADFPGDLSHPKLVLFVGGNYFFVMAPLVQEFEKEHREYLARIYWETIPPGLLVKQIQAGGTITSGNMTWTVKPDAYFAGLMKVKQLIAQGTLLAPAVPYVTNQLTIMVPKDNPAHVNSLKDLGRADMGSSLTAPRVPRRRSDMRCVWRRLPRPS
jgi:molybdate transport system substrate-binding protein